MDYQRISKYYDELYSGHSDSWIKLPFVGEDYYGKPLQLLGCKNGDRLLDIACGTGQLLSRAESLGIQCYGIDISQVAVDRASINCKAKIVCADVNNGLPYNNNYFDYVTCLGVFEHFEKQFFVLNEIKRILKQTGKMYILVPNDDYILHKFGYETDSQPIIKRYSLMCYKNILVNNGFIIERILSNNSHLLNLSESSSYLKLIIKLLVHPFVRFIPIRYSYNFIFICRPAIKIE